MTRVSLLVRRGALSAREALVASALLLGLAAGVYGSYVLDGGFTFVDWAHASYYRFAAEDGGFAGALDKFFEIDAYRPVAALYLPVVHGIFGMSMGAHLAWSVVLAAGSAALFYAVLRTLGIAPLHAWLVAALITIFPASDSTVLWATASIAHAALALYFIGLLVALRAFAESRPRRRQLLHGVSIAAYVASILLYEIALVAIVLSFVVYAFHLHNARRVVPRTAVDWAASATCVWMITSSPWAATREGTVNGIGEQLRRIGEIAGESATLFAQTVLPVGFDRTTVLVSGIVLLVGALAVLRVARDHPAAGELRHWMAVTAAAVLLTAVGYGVFAGTTSWYSPLGPGVINRTNAFAAFGLVLLAYSLIMLVAVLVTTIVRRPALAPVLATLAALAIGTSYIGVIERDKEDWAAAHAAQLRLVSDLRNAVPNPQPGTTVITVAGKGWQAPGVPIFVEPWDLGGAASLYWRTDKTETYPLIEGDALTCTPQGVRPKVRPQHLLRYGSTTIIDVWTGRAVPIVNRQQCAALLPEFPPPAF